MVTPTYRQPIPTEPLPKQLVQITLESKLEKSFYCHHHHHPKKFEI